jgi:hypothetical protein
MGEWKPDVHERVENRDVFVWIVPAKVAGQWTVQDGSRSFTLEIDQQFQELKGNATVDGRAVPIVNGKLDGEQIVFTLEIAGKRAVYRGKVTGDRMEATSGPPATQSGWSATRTKKG